MPTRRVPRLRDVGRAIAFGERRAHRALDRVGKVAALERIAQHHRRRQDRRQRIGDVLARDVGRRAVHRLVQPLAIVRERRGRQHADRAREHRRRVGEDVAEHVARHHDVELRGRAHELHRRRVDEQVRELDVRILLADARDDVAPELHRLEHVGLVDRADLALAHARGAERDVRDALDLGLRVAHRVERLARAARVRAESRAARRSRGRP